MQRLVIRLTTLAAALLLTACTNNTPEPGPTLITSPEPGVAQMAKNTLRDIETQFKIKVKLEGAASPWGLDGAPGISYLGRVEGSPTTTVSVVATYGDLRDEYWEDAVKRGKLTTDIDERGTDCVLVMDNSDLTAGSIMARRKLGEKRIYILRILVVGWGDSATTWPWMPLQKIAVTRLGEI